jgi:putative hydrolase of the HAD superfamily
MAEPVIRAFLFDIGNVLVRFDFGAAYRALAPLSGIQHSSELLARIEEVKLRYEDGQVSRADFLGKVFDFLEFRGSEEDFIAAWQGIFTPNEPMIRLVRSLHGRFPLFLLSNTNCMHVEGLFRDFDVFSLFSGGTYSHVARASKPERRIFEIACAEHGLAPESTFFIDDLPANIGTAQQLGFLTHQYHPDQHEALLDRLRQFGLP